MTWVNHYLDTAVYVDGGRGPIEYDCWGLVREVRAKHLGLSKLPIYGALRNNDPRSFTKAYLSESSKLRQCAPEHGAIAAVMIGKVCAHVGVVLDIDGTLMVLEINPEKSARVVRLNTWLLDHVWVTFHND
jgi:hypothetical protein